MVFIILFALCRKGSAKNILFLMNPLVESQRPLRLCEKRNKARGKVSLSPSHKGRNIFQALRMKVCWLDLSYYEILFLPLYAMPLLNG